MRGEDSQNGLPFSYVNLEERIPACHPLRKLKYVVDAALVDLDADFKALYAVDGWPGIAPERLLRAMQEDTVLPVHHSQGPANPIPSGIGEIGRD